MANLKWTHVSVVHDHLQVDVHVRTECLDEVTEDVESEFATANVSGGCDDVNECGWGVEAQW